MDVDVDMDMGMGVDMDMDMDMDQRGRGRPRARISDPDPRSLAGPVRIVVYSPEAGFVITVIAARIDGALWGVTAWKTTGAA